MDDDPNEKVSISIQKPLVSGTLNRDAIIEAMERGDVIISPFKKENLGTNSYDVSLGKYYWTQSECDPVGIALSELQENNSAFLIPENQTEKTLQIVDPHDVTGYAKRWFLRKAISIHKEEGRNLHKYFPESTLAQHIKNKSKIIIVNPGDHILAHTQEFIGGKTNIFASLASRSTTRRTGFEICGDAGIGDIGYCNIWTLEIGNLTKKPIALVVGYRYAQILFHACVTGKDIQKSTSDKNSYGSLTSHGSKYQTTNNVQANKLLWNPYKMLPKPFLDREFVSLLIVNTAKDVPVQTLFEQFNSFYVLDSIHLNQDDEKDFTKNMDYFILTAIFNTVKKEVGYIVTEIDKFAFLCAQVFPVILHEAFSQNFTYETVKRPAWCFVLHNMMYKKDLFFPYLHMSYLLFCTTHIVCSNKETLPNTEYILKNLPRIVSSEQSEFVSKFVDERLKPRINYILKHITFVVKILNDLVYEKSFEELVISWIDKHNYGNSKTSTTKETETMNHPPSYTKKLIIDVFLQELLTMQ